LGRISVETLAASDDAEFEDVDKDVEVAVVDGSGSVAESGLSTLSNFTLFVMLITLMPAGTEVFT